MKNNLIKISGAVLLCGAFLVSSLQADVGTAWTYQGELTKSGVLYTGTADFLFSLWTDDTTGSQSGSTLTITNLSVASGRFAAQLDFGYDPFSSGQNLWLQIAVRTPGGAGLYAILGNRQPVTSAPYAIRTRGMFVNDSGDVGIGTTIPSLDLQVSRTRFDSFGSGPFSATLGVRHDRLPLLTGGDRTTNWLYLRTGTTGNDLVRNNGSDLHFMREPTIEDDNPLTQMTLTGTGKLLLGTATEQAGMTLQVGSLFGVSLNGRLGFENSSPQAKIHFSNSSDCIRFPNGTVQNTAPFTDTGFTSAASGVPGINSTAFVTTPTRITVTHSSQRVFVLAHQEIGLARLSTGLVLYIGYRLLGSGSVPVLVGQGMTCSFDSQDVGPYFQSLWLIAPFSASAILTNLAPGTYEVGMAGHQDADTGSGYDAGNGYVTAFVF